MPGRATRRRATGASTVGSTKMSPSLHTYIVGTVVFATKRRMFVSGIARYQFFDGGGERAGLAHRVGIAVGGGRQGKGREGKATELSTA
jgi:hypothetical protein